MMYQINNFADEAQPWVRSCGILDGHRGSREREREREMLGILGPRAPRDAIFMSLKHNGKKENKKKNTGKKRS